MRNRRIAVALILAAIMIVSLRHPTANIQITAGKSSDAAGRQVQAAVDLGIFAVSVVVNSAGKRLAE